MRLRSRLSTRWTTARCGAATPVFEAFFPVFSSFPPIGCGAGRAGDGQQHGARQGNLRCIFFVHPIVSSSVHGWGSWIQGWGGMQCQQHAGGCSTLQLQCNQQASPSPNCCDTDPPQPIVILSNLFSPSPIWAPLRSCRCHPRLKWASCARSRNGPCASCTCCTGAVGVLHVAFPSDAAHSLFVGRGRRLFPSGAAAPLRRYAPCICSMLDPAPHSSCLLALCGSASVPCQCVGLHKCDADSTKASLAILFAHSLPILFGVQRAGPGAATPPACFPIVGLQSYGHPRQLACLGCPCSVLDLVPAPILTPYSKQTPVVSSLV